MRTQVMNQPVSGTPWLEHFPNDDSRPERVLIDTLPYTIGRMDSVDFQIDSSRVSREHASIDVRDGLYVIRDNGSTNGTFVNGERIEAEVRLNDGDVVLIADTELSFCTGRADTSTQPCATQVMSSEPTATEDVRISSSSSDLILEVRRLQEALTQRAARCRIQRIYDLKSGDLIGFEVLAALEASEQTAVRAERILHATECRLTERLQELHRLLAAERARRMEVDTHVFFNLHPAEVGAEWLPESLRHLRDVMSDNHKITVEIPDSAVCDIPFFRSFLAKLRELPVMTAYDNFHGGESQVLDLDEIAPDFLKLAPSLVRGISRSSGGQRQVQAIVKAAKEIQSEVIATGVRCEDEAEILAELGCRFAQGDLYGNPAMVSSLSLTWSGG